MSEKTLDNTSAADAKLSTSDIKVVGNGDMWQLLCKASSEKEGWMKSTKAMELPGGVIVQVTTQQKNPDGSYAVAEALTAVPFVVVVEDENGGRKLGKPAPQPISVPEAAGVPAGVVNPNVVDLGNLE